MRPPEAHQQEPAKSVGPDAGLIGRAEFNSDELPEAERSAAYQFVVGGPARLTVLASPFHAHIVSYHLGPMRFHSIDVAPHRFERSAAKVAMDDVDYLAVQYLQEGSVEGDCGGRWMQAGKGTVYVLDFAQPAMLTESGTMRLQLVTVARKLAAERFGELESLHGLVLQPERAAPYIAYLQEVFPTLDRLPRTEGRRLVAETLSAVSKALGRDVGCEIATHEDLDSRALAYIEQQLGSRALTPEALAAALGATRTQLYNVFRARGGVAKYIWSRRVAQVYAALSQGADRRSLTELAYEYGFSNPAHLSHLFRKTYGEAPTGVRRKSAVGGQTRLKEEYSDVQTSP